MLRTDEERKLFFISGFVSIFLFALLLFLFLHMLFAKQKQHTYGLTKKNYISISLETLPQKTQRNHTKKVAKKKKVKKKVQHKRESVDAVSEDIDVDSLFNNVWTKKIDTKRKKKPKIDAKRIAEIQKSVEISKERASNGFAMKKRVEDTHKKSNKAASSAEEVNEYSAKIHAIVYDHFFPPPNTQGHQVKAVIELSPLGKVLDFRILNYSANEALNEEVDSIKERIRSVVFPKNPHNESARVVIILKPEEKE